MKALVFNGPHDIRYETYDEPVMGTPNTKGGLHYDSLHSPRGLDAEGEWTGVLNSGQFMTLMITRILRS